MKNKEKLLRYSERVKIEKIVLGSLWLVSGVCSLFNNIFCLILQILSMAAIIYTIIRVDCAKAESADEMADQNMNKAKAAASDCIYALTSCAATLAMIFLQNITLSVSLDDLIPAVVFFVMGCHSIITGLAFRKFEDS